MLITQFDGKVVEDAGVIKMDFLGLKTLTIIRDALRMIKAGFNADTDGLAGIQELAGNATGLFYMSEEGQEGRNAWLERRPPNFGKYRKRP